MMWRVQPNNLSQQVKPQLLSTCAAPVRSRPRYDWMLEESSLGQVDFVALAPLKQRHTSHTHTSTTYCSVLTQPTLTSRTAIFPEQVVS